MKKSVLVVVALATSIFSFAQGEEASANANANTAGEEELLKNKKGHVILPQAGDIALGFNAVPVVDALLNTLSYTRHGDQNPTSNGTIGDALQYTENQSNVQVVGKYFLTNKTAVRVRFGINSLNGSTTNQVQDAIAMASAINGTQDEIDAASLLTVNDQLDYQKRNVDVVVGYEKRRGYGRLQGFYGGEVGLNFTKADMQVSYGNAYSDLHEVEYTNFNTTNGGLNTTYDPSAGNDNERILSQEFRGGVGFGLRAFIGVEYFFARKMSIAAEYGWGYSYSNSSSATTNREVYHNGQTGPVILEEKTDNDISSSTHNFGVDNNPSGTNGFNTALNNNGLTGSSASITLLLHF